MTFDEAQNRVHQWISKFEEGYFPTFEQLARIVEEVGELARAISHREGVKKPKPNESLHDIEEEFGDLMFVLICFANAHHIRIETAVEKTIQKIETRDTARWTLKKDFTDVQNEKN